MLVIFSLTSVAYADTYKDGSTGKAVEGIQQQLKKLGLFQGEITGYFGPQTETAVKKFQLKRGLHADGVVGTGTYKYLFEGVSKTLITSAKTENDVKHVLSIKEIQTALKKLGYYTGTIDGVTGSKTKAAIQKFQKANKLTADGVVGQTTKTKLIAAAAGTGTSAKASTTTASSTEQKTTSTAAASESKSGVELLDWWKEASKLFKIGSIAKVTDVKTGKTFSIVRTYGTNHADVEALTAKDSEIIKDIWGGWSWTRRPVVVEVNDRKIAASMAAMPHAGVDSQPANTYVSQRSGGYSRGTNLDKIKDNGMSGHMDVHFLNSRTHGTNKVDAKHQAAVKQAAKY